MSNPVRNCVTKFSPAPLPPTLPTPPSLNTAPENSTATSPWRKTPNRTRTLSRIRANGLEFCELNTATYPWPTRAKPLKYRRAKTRPSARPTRRETLRCAREAPHTSFKFFRAALTGKFKEAKEKVVRLHDTDPEVFECVVHWLYY